MAYTQHTGDTCFDPWTDDVFAYVPAQELPVRPLESSHLLEVQQRVASYLRLKIDGKFDLDFDWKGPGLPPPFWYCGANAQYKAYRSYEDYQDDKKLQRLNPHN